MLQDSSIIIRVENFLKDIHPFCYMNKADQRLISSHTEVAVYTAHTTIFRQGGQPGYAFYVVKKGAVDIIEESDSGHMLIDKCGEGDMFGIRPLLAESTYMYTAISTEDTIIYEIPLERFIKMYRQYDRAVDYMVKRFAAGTSIRDTYTDAAKVIPSQAIVISPVLPQSHKQLIVTAETSTLDQAVRTMHEHKVSSIVVTNDTGCPIGIITDRDIRRMVATHYDGDRPVVEVMSHPVKTIRPGMVLQEVQLTMIESGLHHLCVTEDGTPHTRGIGMITEHDLLYASATDPVVILKKIKAASTIEQLKTCRQKIDSLLPNFLNESLNRRFTLSMISKLNSALMQRAVNICLQAYNTTHTPIGETDFCFYTMGSAARGEQLLMTDQDNGLIIVDTEAHRKPDFLKLGLSITDALSEIGYERCPANMMASNPDWCKTVTEMKESVYQWLMSPGPDEVLLTAIFFDFRVEYGNEAIATDLNESIAEWLSTQDNYLRFLAKQTVSNPPPLSFFRKFIIEKDGEHKDMFDIKLRGIAPLSDCARVLALDDGYLASSSTYDRYEALKVSDPANAVLYADAAEAYIDLLSFRLQFALANNDSGRYIDISQLEKLHRIYLRRAFVPTRQLLDMIERKFRLSYL